MKSVKRTTENSIDLAAAIPAVRFTDYDLFAPDPSSELLGYYHSSAMRTHRINFLYKANVDSRLWTVDCSSLLSKLSLSPFQRLPYSPNNRRTSAPQSNIQDLQLTPTLTD
jgi:hypothetical protein